MAGSEQHLAVAALLGWQLPIGSLTPINAHPEPPPPRRRLRLESSDKAMFNQSVSKNSLTIQSWGALSQGHSERSRGRDLVGRTES